MTSSVTVCGPNGRREAIRVTPSTTLSQIRDSFCDRVGPSSLPRPSSELGLRVSRAGSAPLDLSLPFRLSGLSPGTTLEVFALSPAPSTTAAASGATGGMARVCVQMPDGRRVEGAHDAEGTTMWGLMRAGLGEQPERALVGEGGVYLRPTCVVLGREVAGLCALRTTTLRAMGITQANGPVLVRASLKKTTENAAKALEREAKEEEAVIAARRKEEQDREDARRRAREQEEKRKAAVAAAPVVPAPVVVSQVAQTTQEMDELEQRIAQAQVAAAMQDPALRQAIEAFKAQVMESQMQEEQQPLQAVPQAVPVVAAPKEISFDLPEEERKVEVFAPSETSGGESFVPDLPDDFYELTTDDLREIRAEETKAKQESAMLMTQAMRDKIRNAKWAKFRRSVVRVRMPDRVELQRHFHPRDKVSSLVSFVRDCLVPGSPAFTLFTTPPYQAIGSEKATLLERGLVPAALVHLKWASTAALAASSANALKPELYSSIRRREMPQGVVTAPLPPTSIAAAAPPPVSNRKLCGRCLAKDAEFECVECAGNMFCRACWAEEHTDEKSSHHDTRGQHSVPKSAAHDAVSDHGAKDSDQTRKVPKWFAKGKKF